MTIASLRAGLRPLGRLRFDPIGYVRHLDLAYRQRRHLEELPPHLLADIGLTREDIGPAMEGRHPALRAKR